MLVAGGIYYPDSDSNPATPPTRAATFEIPEGVIVEGGYRGCTFGAGDPDCANALVRDEESILDGNIGNAALSSDNCLHVVMIANVAPEPGGGELTRLDGFTVRNGNSTPDHANPPLPPEPFPCCCDSEQPEVFKLGGECDCVGSDPESFGEIGVPGDGGAGVHLHNVSDRVFVVDCRIESCTGKYGGGMRCVCASPIVSECVFSRNDAQNGAGLYCYGASSPKVFNSFFILNDSTHIGGGAAMQWYGSAQFTNCVFYDNEAGDWGGGVRSGIDCSPTLAHCTFAKNKTTNVDSEGGGFSANRDDPPGDGAVTLRGCIIHANTAPTGAQVYIQDNESLNVKIGFCCITSNQVADIDGDYVDEGDNLFEDPLFVDVNDVEGLGLSDGSLCIDSGNTPDVPADAANLDGDASLTERVPLDAAPLNRFFRDKVDRGAFESEFCKADIDGDETVDGTDMSILLGAWGTCDSPCPSDLTSSNAVDSADLAILFETWGSCANNAAMMAGPGEEGEASSEWAGPLTPQMLAEAFGLSDVTELAQYLGSLDFEMMQAMLEAYFGG